LGFGVLVAGGDPGVADPHCRTAAQTPERVTQARTRVALHVCPAETQNRHGCLVERSSADAAQHRLALREPAGTSPLVTRSLTAPLVPSLAIAYAMYAGFVICTKLFAQPAVASVVLHWPYVIAQVLFTPLIIMWSIWVGIAISTRSSDVRVAQQLGALGLPVLLVAYLISFNVIHMTLGLALGIAVVLLVLDGLGWRFVAAAFDRERLITNTS